jgi:two-component system chemotaxis response regulator CheB
MARSGTPAVALVCSAGGLEALQQVLGALRSGFGGSVLVAMHQPPYAELGRLVRILGRRTELPVDVAVEGAPLVPGRVQVAPPGKHLLVDRDERIALIPAGPVPPARPSADLLLTTLAVATGPRCVAVVLSGSGRDGATGATAVHRFGGTVVASDASSSEYFGMPSETIGRDHAVDHVLPVHRIGPLLIELTAGVRL